MKNGRFREGTAVLIQSPAQFTHFPQKPTKVVAAMEQDRYAGLIDNLASSSPRLMGL